MSAASDYLEKAALDHILGKGTRDFTSPTSLRVGLFTTMPTSDDGTGGTEVSGFDYVRQEATFNAASLGAGTATTSGDLTFGPANGGDFGTILGIGIFDDTTGGNLLIFTTLAAQKTVSDGDTFVISAGNLTVSLA